MTVKELREQLKDLPDDYIVMKEITLSDDRGWIENVNRIETHMKTETDCKAYVTLV